MIAAKAKEPGKAKKADAPGQKAKQQPASPQAPAINPLWQQLALGVQAKLAVSAPGDPYEREADRVADQVMRMPEPRIQRQCATCEEEQEKLSRKESGNVADAPTTVPPVVHEALSVPGQPLDSATREFFEPRFGHDFSQVRVHAGSKAADGARAVRARAYTIERDIVFGSGEYAPGAIEGKRLLAHELTHVIQHDSGILGAGGAGPARVARAAERLADSPPGVPAPSTTDAQPFSGIQTPTAPASSVPGGSHMIMRQGSVPAPAAGATPASPPPPAAGPSPAAVKAASSEVVELQGHRTFDPSKALAEMIDYLSPASLLVRVRFGTLASGAIYMRKGTAGYNSVDDPAMIALHHPAFPGAGYFAPPRMQLSIVDSVVTGHVQFFPWDRVPGALAGDWKDAFPLERLLGWKGLRNIKAASFTNEVKDGVLRYSLDNFGYQLDGEWEGVGNFSVVDDKVGFSGETDIKALGVADGKMPLKRVAGRVFGSTKLSLKLSPVDAFGGTFSGSIEGSFVNGVTNITGTAGYKSSKLNGSVTVKVAPVEDAWVQLSHHLLPGIHTAAVHGATTKHVVYGWGTLDFHFNEWLTGRASVVVDPAGYITSFGAIRPTKTFEFLKGDKLSARKPIGPKVSASAFKPVWGPTGVTGTIEGQLTAAGRIGPGRLHELQLSGVFSTNPAVPLKVELSGVVDLSAIGRIELDLTGSLAYTLLGKHVRTVAIEVNVLGTGTLKVYARLEPAFSVEKATGSDTQFRMKGVLKAAVGVSLGLSGSIKPSIFGFGPRFRTGKYEWHVGGIGVKSMLDYRIGDPEGPSLDFDDYKYDPTEFHNQAERLLDDAADKDKKKHETEVSVDETKPKPPSAPKAPPKKFSFTMRGTYHQLWVESDPTPAVQMASGSGTPLKPKLHAEAAQLKKEEAAATGDQQALIQAEQAEVSAMLQQTIGVESSVASLEAEDKPQADVAGIEELASELQDYGQQFGKTDLATDPDDQDTDKKELLPGEGLVGTYATLKGKGTRGDDVTPHHMPQDKYMAQKLAGNPGGEEWVYSEGICMNMYHPTKTPKKGRHFYTRTYGSKGNPPRYSETPTEALENDIANVRSIYQKDGLLNNVITDGLDMVRSLNLKNYPKLFGGS